MGCPGAILPDRRDLMARQGREGLEGEGSSQRLGADHVLSHLSKERDAMMGSDGMRGCEWVNFRTRVKAENLRFRGGWRR